MSGDRDAAPSFDDYWGPTQWVKSSPDKPRYWSEMVGSGRWCLLTYRGTLHAVLWTNDYDGLGAYPAEGCDADANGEINLGLHRMAEGEISATDGFDFLAHRYGADPIYSGLLEDLRAQL